jgi:hypothetical protein
LGSFPICTPLLPVHLELLFGCEPADMRMSGIAWMVTVGVLSILAIVVLANIPPMTNCATGEPFSAKHYQIRASRIEVQPWRGPHHVYGMFIVPEHYKRDRLYTAKLMIQGFPEEFTHTSPEGEDADGGRTEPGYYIKRLYLPTRTALWFLLTGRFGDLKMPCHWWLVIEDRVR